MIMQTKHFHIFDVIWDATPKELQYLPQTLKVSITSEDVNDVNDKNDIELFLENYLSNTTGFCHYGFQYDELN